MEGKGRERRKREGNGEEGEEVNDPILLSGSFPSNRVILLINLEVSTSKYLHDIRSSRWKWMDKWFINLELWGNGESFVRRYPRRSPRLRQSQKGVTDAKEKYYYLEVYDDNARNIWCCRTRNNEEQKRFSKYCGIVTLPLHLANSYAFLTCHRCQLLRSKPLGIW